MKFTYWGGVRSGKFQIWQLFELNGKKTAVFSQSGKKWPAYALIYGNELNHLLYEENGQIKNKHCKSTVFENGVYKNNFQTNVKFDLQLQHRKYHRGNNFHPNEEGHRLIANDLLRLL